MQKANGKLYKDFQVLEREVMNSGRNFLAFLDYQGEKINRGWTLWRFQQNTTGFSVELINKTDSKEDNLYYRGIPLLKGGGAHVAVFLIE